MRTLKVVKLTGNIGFVYTSVAEDVAKKVGISYSVLDTNEGCCGMKQSLTVKLVMSSDLKYDAFVAECENENIRVHILDVNYEIEN